MSAPPDLDRALAVVASTFHFSRSEIWDMPLDELKFWVKQANWLRTPPR